MFPCLTFGDCESGPLARTPQHPAHGVPYRAGSSTTAHSGKSRRLKPGWNRHSSLRTTGQPVRCWDNALATIKFEVGSPKISYAGLRLLWGGRGFFDLSNARDFVEIPLGVATPLAIHARNAWAACCASSTLLTSSSRRNTSVAGLSICWSICSRINVAACSVERTKPPRRPKMRTGGSMAKSVMPKQTSGLSDSSNRGCLLHLFTKDIESAARQTHLQPGRGARLPASLPMRFRHSER